jgi:hypothetical protein
MFDKRKKIDDESSRSHSRIPVNSEMNNLFPPETRRGVFKVIAFLAMTLSGVAAEPSSKDDDKMRTLLRRNLFHQTVVTACL